MEEPSGQIPFPLENLELDRNGLLLLTEPEESPSSPPVCLDVGVVPEHETEELKLSISDLQGEISTLRSKQRYLDGKRREALNKILDTKGSVRVFCRVRSADNRILRCPVSTTSEKITVRPAGARKEFSVDRVFPPETTQGDVFGEVEPILRSALDGHNVCIFAYGQTGTGKTFTMEGAPHQPGIVPLAIEELFRQASLDRSASFAFSMSMLEVYMGSLRDLLAQQRISSARATELRTKSKLSIQTSSNGSVEVEGLTDVAIGDRKQASRWYAKGKQARSTSWTHVNESSSRSHCLTRISIGQSGDTVGKGSKVVSKLWMVDLGGSERLLKTGATGQRMDEGKAINLSLSALGDVIAALKWKRNHIPYRNSKLTQILSDSLGDGSKVLMLVHISPSGNDVGETICSLNFAKRARAIESNRELSEDLIKQKENCLAELDRQMKDAEEELQKVGNQIQKAEYLVQEKKKLFLMKYQPLDDQKGPLLGAVAKLSDCRRRKSTGSSLRASTLAKIPKVKTVYSTSLIIGYGDVSESPRTTEKAVSKTRSSSLPRFMTSTACSRQRQSSAGEKNSRVRTSRSRNISSVDLFGSQSCSFKSNPQYLKNRSMNCETKNFRLRNLSSLCNSENLSYYSADSKSSTIPGNRRISTSHPNLRVTLCQHRRRMSDLT